MHGATDPRIFEKECTTLAHAGYDVLLVATGDAPHAAEFRVIALRRASTRPVRMMLGGMRAIWQAVRFRPDLVHLHDPELIPFIPILKARGIRVIFDAHEDIPATMLRKPYLSPHVRRIMAWFGRILVSAVDHAADGVVVATPAIGKGYSRAPQCLVQNFPIVSAWKVAERDALQTPRLVYVGAISEGRCIWQMMDLISTLGPRHDAQLVLAGPVTEQLLDRLRSHAGWRHTDFLGTLDRPEIVELLSTCTVGVVLFQPEPNHVESQPTKMFEYMAAGLPILGSDFALWRKLVLDQRIGALANPMDVDAIARAAEVLISDPHHAAEMGQRGRRIAEQSYNWRVEGDRLVNFYNDLLNGEPWTMLQRIKTSVRQRRADFAKARLRAKGGAGAEVYDAAYDGSIEEYTQHFSQSRYLPVWLAIADRIKPGSRVLEIGCGPAQLATMLIERGVIGAYVGFDFSPNAIELARKNLPGYRFEIDDARTTQLVTEVEWDLAICTEVLEHIVDDLWVLERIPAGRQVLATVPDFDYESHVRFFKDVDAVHARYGHLFSHLDVSVHHHAGDADGHHGTFFLLDGTRA